MSSLVTDEISALVLDPGSTWTRAGFAGEDTPKAVIPTDYGITPDGKFYFGDNDVHTVRPGMEIRNPMKDGVGMFQWQHCYKHVPFLTMRPGRQLRIGM